MEEMISRLKNTLEGIANAIDSHLTLLTKTSKLEDKKTLVQIVLSLSKSQENTARAIDILGGSDPFGDFDDYEDYDNDEFEPFDRIPSGRQLEFTPPPNLPPKKPKKNK